MQSRVSSILTHHQPHWPDIRNICELSTLQLLPATHPATVSHSAATTSDNDDVASPLRLFHCSCLSHSGVDDATLQSVAERMGDCEGTEAALDSHRRWSAMREHCVDRLQGDASRRFADNITGGWTPLNVSCRGIITTCSGAAKPVEKKGKSALINIYY